MDSKQRPGLSKDRPEKEGVLLIPPAKKLSAVTGDAGFTGITDALRHHA